MDVNKVKLAARISIRIAFGFVLLVVFWSCAQIPGVKDETVTPVIRVPFVRVLLADNKDKVTVAADGAIAIECLDKGQQTVYYSAHEVSVTNDGMRLRVETNRGDIIQEGLDEVNFLPRGTNSHVKLDNQRYRGILKCLPYGRNVRLVNIVYMEDYLRGVVPPEIGPRTENEIEAIKAQAVAARTYSAAHLQQYGSEPYDLKSTVEDQVYSGLDIENKLVNKAIDLTIGDVAMYQDDFINAYYHSTCGGITDDINQVWDKKALPYLVPVIDSAACSWSKYYTWQEQFTEQQLRGRLQQYLSSDRGREIRIDPITDIKVEELTAGGRVSKLVVHTQTDVYRFYKDRIRWAIGRASNPDLILPSDKFDVEIKRNGGGKIESVTFKGKGYGHGVGMCQCGAIGLARSGLTYDVILKKYYTGINIKKLY